MIIRPETPGDYAAVMQIHIRAFEQRLDEALIVAYQRQRPGYDAALSLVAEVEGRVVGHALFIPTTINLLEERVAAVNLAPIGVDPAYQGRGIGGALMEAGHTAARVKGFALSYLLGHSEYYPRFGYKTEAFGDAALTLNPGTLLPMPELEVRRPVEDDIPALHALWQKEERAVDFAIDPGQTLFDWISPNPNVEAWVYLHDGQITGYTRHNRTRPDYVNVFLAASGEAAHAVAAHIGAGQSTLTLPLHPYSASASAFEGATATAWMAAMARPLADDTLFIAYYEQCRRGERHPGRPTWGTAFDVG